VWLSFDRHAADMQDLLLNEPWFLIEGLLGPHSASRSFSHQNVAPG